jgi:hypothetical protein
MLPPDVGVVADKMGTFFLSFHRMLGSFFRDDAAKETDRKSMLL